jgi:hypothetical protein
MTSRLFRFWPALAVASLVFVLPRPSLAAEPEEATLSRVVELNKKALALYEALDVENASYLLKQALELCKSAGVEKHPIAARTHVHLGVVYLSGLRDRELGLAEFRKALAIDPKIKITKSLHNPEVQAAFAEVQSEASTPSKPADLPFPTKSEPSVPSLPEASPESEKTGFGHPVVTRASRDTPVDIKAQVPPGLGATKVMLAYRPADGEEFLAREMRPLEGAASWYQATIPASATRGAQVSYFIEISNPNEKILASSGSPEAPHVVTLVGEDPAVEARPAQPVVKEKPRDEGKTGPGWWLVLALGSGGGYHSGSPEMNPKDPMAGDISVSGFGYSRLFHLSPEIGRFLGHGFILSLLGRFQFITGTQDVLIGDRTYHPAEMAFAGFTKLTWLLRNEARLLPFLSTLVGFGQIRHVVTTPESAKLSGCGSELTCKDTVLGGAGFTGLGAGFIYMMSRTIGLHVSVTTLIGLPHLMIHSDLNLGVAIMR